jgi:hypothetical protein
MTDTISSQNIELSSWITIYNLFTWSFTKDILGCHRQQKLAVDGRIIESVIFI